MKLIEQKQSDDLRYQSKFMKDLDQSDSVIDYIDHQVKVDHDTIDTLDTLYDASELTDKYFGYSPYEDTYIPYSDATLQATLMMRLLILKRPKRWTLRMPITRCQPINRQR